MHQSRWLDIGLDCKLKTEVSQLQKEKTKDFLLKEPKKLANESSFTFILKTLLKHSPFYVSGTVFSKTTKHIQSWSLSKINKLATRNKK